MDRFTLAAGLAAALSLTIASPSIAEQNFNRIASFATPANMAEGEDRSRPTSLEIIAASGDGMTLVYTDSPLKALGLIDISDPANPKPLGNIMLDGEPTSVAVTGNNAFVAINTSPDYVNPSGMLKVFDIASGNERISCDLGGQPDSIALSRDGGFVMIAIENERDEDLNDGALPQNPAGFVVRFDNSDGVADCGSKKVIALAGMATEAPSDPEPEFVAVNDLGETVVTLQENNHLAVIDADGNVSANFSAGVVDVDKIDNVAERALRFIGALRGVPREPDAVKWLDNDHVVTANEGDYKGGTRGWTIFNKDGSVVYDSGAEFEKAIVEIGHYPEKRSAKKGVEPESVETARFGDTPMAFIGSERASIVGVYDVSDPSSPVLRQLLPSGIGPEGILAIPERNLLVTANEVDLVEDGGIRAHVMIYELQDGPAAYPSITSRGAVDGSGQAIGWGALSGLVADPETPGKLYGVNDSFYAMQPTIFEIDASESPARIIAAIPVTRSGAPAQKLDMEGITTDGNGGFWIASEGRTDRVVPHALYNVDAQGNIKKEVGLPAELMAVEKRFGFEGITRIGDTLWMAVQREWKDDPKDHVKLVSYGTSTGDWGAVLYPKEPAEKGWTGLSEITAFGGEVYVIERDNQIGGDAKVKRLYAIDINDLNPAPLGTELPVVSKKLVHDFVSDLLATNGYVQDKLEGFAIDTTGEAFAVTDNDGVDDHSGETHFIRLGRI